MTGPPASAANRATSRNYRRPHRPLAVRIVNALGRLAPRSPSLERGHLLATAARRADGRALQDRCVLEPLGVLLRSIEDEARLTTLGRFMVGQRIVGQLANLIRAEAAEDEHPEIRELDLDPVVMIVGLQRTGTTLLHRLLASDPAARAVLGWESINPAPLPGEAPGETAVRLAWGVRAERFMHWLDPQFTAVHPIDARAPEEEVMLMDLSFMSQVPESMVHVPSYSAWLERQDGRPAYAMLVRMLRLLQWQRGARRWVLKSPVHLEHLDLVLETFPDVRVLFTHRDPSVATGSFCSMVAHLHGQYSGRVDPAAIGKHWSRKTRRMIERSMAVRDGMDSDQALDVHYHDLVSDPIGQARRIHDWLGVGLTSDVEARMGAMLASNPRHRHGRHVYDLGDFGLAREAILRELAPYLERFGVALEPVPGGR